MLNPAPSNYFVLRALFGCGTWLLAMRALVIGSPYWTVALTLVSLSTLAALAARGQGEFSWGEMRRLYFSLAPTPELRAGSIALRRVAFILLGTGALFAVISLAVGRLSMTSVGAALVGIGYSLVAAGLLVLWAAVRDAVHLISRRK